MLSFNSFLEVLNSEFEVQYNNTLRDNINNQLKDKVFPGHTTVMSSEHMLKHDLAVLRLKNKNHEVEYHLINYSGVHGKLPAEKQNQKALLHSLKIIKDDSKSYLERGNKIKLQAATDDQHENYKKLSKHILKDHPDKNVKDVGYNERIDGEGTARTLMIEGEGFNAVNWTSLISY